MAFRSIGSEWMLMPADLSSRISWIARYSLACALIVVAGYAAGCSKRPSAATPPPQMTIDVISDQLTNNGQPFYLVIRSINDKQFLTDTYQGIAGLVYCDPPDPSVLSATPIFPGKVQQLKLIKSGQMSVGFYFLFSQPMDEWKRMLSQPLSDSGYEITLTKNVITVKPKKSFWRRIF